MVARKGIERFAVVYCRSIRLAAAIGSKLLLEDGFSDGRLQIPRHAEYRVVGQCKCRRGSIGEPASAGDV
jgi:hypothetical protein